MPSDEAQEEQKWNHNCAESMPETKPLYVKQQSNNNGEYQNILC